MVEVSIDRKELDRFIDKLEQTPEVVREAKRQAFEAAAPKLKAAVDAQIGGTGKVKSWQEQYVGSRGGYAAVRPKAKTYTEPTRAGKTYAVGYVTNAINSGHRFPSPSGRDKYYRPRIHSGGMKVPGREFYQKAEAQTAKVAQDAAQEIVDAVKRHLEG